MSQLGAYPVYEFSRIGTAMTVAVSPYTGVLIKLRDHLDIDHQLGNIIEFNSGVKNMYHRNLINEGVAVDITV